MQKVVIVVPIYKDYLTNTEKIAYDQLYKILGNYPIYAIAPTKISEYAKNEFDNVEYFEDEYFESVLGYSKLLLSKKFYERFSGFEYMLIYQLDAFVFKDKLIEFCKLGYDYIGGPLHKATTEWRRLNIQVGNGGLSLRNIASCLNALNYKDEIYKSTNKGEIFDKGEDLFFSYVASLENIDFTAADIRTAAKFAIADNLSHSFDNIKENLPFGCHGWNQYDYDKWKEIIGECGYDMPDLPIRNSREIRCMEYLVSKASVEKYQWVHDCLNKVLAEKNLRIYGYGLYGKECKKFLEFYGYNICGVLDKSFPDFNLKKNNDVSIIITPLISGKDIIKELKKEPDNNHNKYYLWEDIKRELLYSYLRMWSEQSI